MVTLPSFVILYKFKGGNPPQTLASIATSLMGPGYSQEVRMYALQILQVRKDTYAN